METLTVILNEQRRQEAHMRFRHPWFDVAYNYMMLATFVALAISLIIWGVSVHTERVASTMAAAAMENYQAQLQAEEDAREQELAAERASENYIIEQEAKEMAKAFYGLRRFIERYGYTDADLETYARCMFNRADASKASLQSVIQRKDQFLGYADDNPILDVYYQKALGFVTTWHSETVKPCDMSYQWAELTEHGIYLVNEYGADGYVRRWQA